MILPIHTQITLTFNRATLLKRALYSFLQQGYEGHANLLIFNTGEKLSLGEFFIPENRRVILINSDKDYNSVGEKYNKSLEYLPIDTQTVNNLDDDDMTTSDHITKGVEGLIKGRKSAYKPGKSWFHHQGNLTLEANVMEGSIFMKADHLREHKFHPEYSVKYHDKWLTPLLTNDDIFVDPQGKSTFIYDWSIPPELRTYKMSGRVESQENYQISKVEARDIGNGILIPSSKHIINDKRLY